MADIQLHNFPDATLPADDADYLYLSQSSLEKKVTLANLSAKFNLMDVYGLVESDIVNNDFFPFVDVSVSLDIDGNRKVSAQNISNYIQEKQHFTTGTSVAEADTIVKRVSGSEVLTEITVADLRDDILDFAQLDTETATVDGDLLPFFDLSEGEPNKISAANFRLSMLTPTNLNAMGDVGTGDYFFVYDSSAGSAEKLEYSALVSALSTSLAIPTYVTLNTTQTISGVKTFTSQQAFNSGLKTNTISENTAGSGVTIDSVLLKDNIVQATQLSGLFKPNQLYPSSLGQTYSGLREVYKKVSDAYDYIKTPIAGSFLLVSGSNTSTQEASWYGRGGIVPTLTGSFVLGTVDLEWEAIYANKGYFTEGISARGISKLENVYVKGTRLTLDDGKINPAIMPSGSEIGSGAMQVATAADMADIISKNAVTPWSLGQSHKELQYCGSAITPSNTAIGSTSVYGGGIKFGNFVVNYGFIEFTDAYGTGSTEILLDWIQANGYRFLNHHTVSMHFQSVAKDSNNADTLDKVVIRNSTSGGAGKNHEYARIRIWKYGSWWETRRINYLAIGLG